MNRYDKMLAYDDKEQLVEYIKNLEKYINDKKVCSLIQKAIKCQ